MCKFNWLISLATTLSSGCLLHFCFVISGLQKVISESIPAESNIRVYFLKVRRRKHSNKSLFLFSTNKTKYLGRTEDFYSIKIPVRIYKFISGCYLRGIYYRCAGCHLSEFNREYNVIGLGRDLNSRKSLDWALPL